MCALQKPYDSLIEHCTNVLMLTMLVEFGQKLYKLETFQVPMKVWNLKIVKPLNVY